MSPGRAKSTEDALVERCEGLREKPDHRAEKARKNSHSPDMKREQAGSSGNAEDYWAFSAVIEGIFGLLFFLLAASPPSVPLLVFHCFSFCVSCPVVSGILHCV